MEKTPWSVFQVADIYEGDYILTFICDIELGMTDLKELGGDMCSTEGHYRFD